MSSQEYLAIHSLSYFPCVLLFLKYTVILSVVYIDVLKSMTVTFTSSLDIICFQNLSILLFQQLVLTHYFSIVLTMARLRHYLKQCFSQLIVHVNDLQILVTCSFQFSSSEGILEFFISKIPAAVLVILRLGHMLKSKGLAVLLIQPPTATHRSLQVKKN